MDLQDVFKVNSLSLLILVLSLKVVLSYAFPGP